MKKNIQKYMTTQELEDYDSIFDENEIVESGRPALQLIPSIKNRYKAVMEIISTPFRNLVKYTNPTTHHINIYPEMLDVPLQNEPVGISIRERQSVHCERLDHSSMMPTSVNEGSVQSIKEISISLKIIFSTLFGTGVFGLALESVNNTSISSLTTVAIFAGIFVFPFMISFHTKAKYWQKVLDTQNIMDNVRWSSIYYKTIHLAKNRGCGLPSDFKLIEKIINRRHPGTHLPMLTDMDIVGIVRLCESMNLVMHNCDDPLQIDINGEQSELLGRVVETLTGQDMKMVAHEFDNLKRHKLEVD